MKGYLICGVMLLFLSDNTYPVLEDWKIKTFTILLGICVNLYHFGPYQEILPSKGIVHLLPLAFNYH